MSDNQPDEQDIAGAFHRMRELNDELKALDSATSQEALDRQNELTDELMTLDMGLQPFRKAMGQRSTASDSQG